MYELCLKLKKAGYYQRYDYSPYALRRYYISDGIAINLEQAQKMYNLGDLMTDGTFAYLNDVLTYIPSLEELIDSCKLDVIVNNGSSGVWETLANHWLETHV